METTKQIALANQHIKQLCSTVNTLAGFQKVRAEDFIVSSGCNPNPTIDYEMLSQEN
jgi:hypothetical protein